MFEVASSPVEPQTAMSPAPMSTCEAGGGAGVETVIDELPDLPPADALIVATPAATPVTSPDVETVATALFDELHLKVVADPGGFAVAVSGTVVPAATVALEGDTEIDFTFFARSALGERCRQRVVCWRSRRVEACREREGDADRDGSRASVNDGASLHDLSLANSIHRP